MKSAPVFDADQNGRSQWKSFDARREFVTGAGVAEEAVKVNAVFAFRNAGCADCLW